MEGGGRPLELVHRGREAVSALWACTRGVVVQRFGLKLLLLA